MNRSRPARADITIPRMARSGRGKGRPQLAPILVLLVLAAVVAAAIYLYRREGVGAPKPPAVAAPGTIRLATWNLKQFTDDSRTDLRMVSQIIRDANFDLVAIQEVKKTGARVDELLNVLGSPWRATHFSPMTGNERFVFIYKGDRLVEIDPPRLIPVSQPGMFERVPYQAYFRAGAFDFTVVSVHLFYSRTDQRRREAQALAQFAADFLRTSPEKDLIILGDFNEQKSNPNIGLFNSAGLDALIRQPTNLGSKEIFDNLLISLKFTGEWTRTSGVVPFDEMLFGNNDVEARARVSDHRPAYADFSTAGPDDD